MADDMHTIPPRVNTLEQGVHTLTHRVMVLEDTHRDTPLRITRVELAVERLPNIEAQLKEQSSQIDSLSSVFKTGVNRIIFTLGGMGSAFAVWQIGPQVLQFLGAR